MSQYELILLLNEEKELKKIKEDLASAGKLLEEKKWGERKLAFPIKKVTTANFYEWRLDIDPKNIAELKKKLNFNEKLLRYLLLKTEEKNGQ